MLLSIVRGDNRALLLGMPPGKSGVELGGYHSFSNVVGLKATLHHNGGPSPDLRTLTGIAKKP